MPRLLRTTKNSRPVGQSLILQNEVFELALLPLFMVKFLNRLVEDCKLVCEVEFGPALIDAVRAGHESVPEFEKSPRNSCRKMAEKSSGNT